MQKNNGKYNAAYADTGRKAGDGNGGLKKTVLMVVLVLLLLFCARTRPGLCAEIVAGPILQRTGDTMMTMLWETDKVSHGEVTYGRPSEKECTSISTGPGTHHIVALTDLEPGQEYEYSITDGVQTLYRSYFHTVPTDGSYRAVLVGDTHAPREGFSTLVPIIGILKADFIIFLGDMVSHGTDLSEWLVLLEIGRVLFDHIPVFTVVGTMNGRPMPDPHCTTAFFPNRTIRRTEPTTYEVRIAGDRFIFLDVEKKKIADMMWLFTTLLDSGKNRDGHHIFVFSHKGITSYKGGRSGCYELRQLEPVMAACGVTALFSGHDHHYVRGRSHLGLPFFISGGGGGAPYEINGKSFLARLAGRMESSYKGLHFLVLDVSGGRCTVRAVDDRGRTVDEVDLGARR